MSVKCKAPFLSMALWPSGQIAPCCRMSGDDAFTVDTTDTLDQAFYLDYFADLRHQMITGNITNQACIECIEDSAHDKHALVNYYNRVYRDVDISEPNLKYLHLSFSNKCTMACKICTPDFSSRISNVEYGVDMVKSSYTDTESFLSFLERIIPTVDHVVLHGGNPINDDMFLIFAAVTESYPELDLTIFTNGTTTKNNGVCALEKLSHLSNLTFAFSLDSVVNVNDYTRIYGKYETVIQNISLTRKIIPSSRIIIHSVVSNQTLYKFVDFYTECMMFDCVDDLSSYVIRYPECYRVSNLPTEYKNRIKWDIVNFRVTLKARYRQHRFYESIINAIDTVLKLIDVPFKMEEWYEYVNTVKNKDKTYGLDTLTHQPSELRSYFDEIIGVTIE